MNITELFQAAKLATDLSIGEISIALHIEPGRLLVRGLAVEEGTRQRHNVVEIMNAIQVDEFPLTFLEGMIRNVDEDLKRALNRRDPDIDWDALAARVRIAVQVRQFSFHDIEKRSGADREAVHRLWKRGTPLDAQTYLRLKEWLDEEGLE